MYYNGTADVSVGGMNFYDTISFSATSDTTTITTKIGPRYISLRPDSSTWYSTIYYDTNANEALIVGFKTSLTSFIVKSGDSNITTTATTSYVNMTPSIQVKGQSLYVNNLIPTNITPNWNLYVNSTIATQYVQAYNICSTQLLPISSGPTSQESSPVENNVGYIGQSDAYWYNSYIRRMNTRHILFNAIALDSSSNEVVSAPSITSPNNVGFISYYNTDVSRTALAFCSVANDTALTPFTDNYGYLGTYSKGWYKSYIRNAYCLYVNPYYGNNNGYLGTNTTRWQYLYVKYAHINHPAIYATYENAMASTMMVYGGNSYTRPFTTPVVLASGQMWFRDGNSTPYIDNATTSYCNQIYFEQTYHINTFMTEYIKASVTSSNSDGLYTVTFTITPGSTTYQRYFNTSNTILIVTPSLDKGNSKAYEFNKSIYAYIENQTFYNASGATTVTNATKIIYNIRVGYIYTHKSWSTSDFTQHSCSEVRLNYVLIGSLPGPSIDSSVYSGIRPASGRYMAAYRPNN
jgi:hypothetical protein